MAGGIVFDIMKYSVHDGPGIRTTVFLKGCPLSCRWCHNPESRRPEPQLMFFAERCIGCGECAGACPHGAVVPLDSEPEKPAPVTGRCTGCGSCVAVCHAGARELAGREMTAARVLAEIERDVVFYDQSGGGVTFSGGEPLVQQGFLLELLAGCREREIHTAVDTTGCAPLGKLLAVSKLTDLFLFDLKVMDDKIHRKYTGVSNRLILDNLRELASEHGNITVRIPVISGINDDDNNITATGRFVSQLPGVRSVHLLPYHRAGVEKYRRLGLAYSLPDLTPPGEEKMNAIANKLRKFGLVVQVGH